jgi:hypothetical protein
MSLIQAYNEEREQMADKLSGYIESIQNELVKPDVLRLNIERDVGSIKRKYSNLFGRADRKTFRTIEKNLSSNIISYKELCHQLNRIINILIVKEE